MAARCKGNKKTFCERKTVKGRYGKASFFPLALKRFNSVSAARRGKIEYYGSHKQNACHVLQIKAKPL
jgi:hypothetical protein